VVPILSMFGVWFLGRDTFGLSVQADKMIVTPRSPAPRITGFKFSRPVQVVTRDEMGDEEEEECGGSGGGGGKRVKVEEE